MSTMILSNEDAKTIIAANVARLMVARGMKQHALAEASGQNQMAISRVVRAAHVPSAAMLANIAEALGVTADELLSKPKKSRRTA